MIERLEVGSDPDRIAALAAAQKVYLEKQISLDEDECMNTEDGHGLAEGKQELGLAASDPFLAELNSRHLDPAQYAWQLTLKHNLTRQQTLAIAPVVQCLQQMYDNRSNPMTHVADGQPQQACRCLWLGAGGSGKTYSYTKVVRPMLQHFCGAKSYIATAPTHAATRLLGLESHTLHKVANVSPQSRLDRHSIRRQAIKRTPLEKAIEMAVALILDELSMSPSDIYHGAGYRCSVLRPERLSLNLEHYMALDFWFGKMPIGIQLGDFFQLRPTAQKSLCEWLDENAVENEEDQDCVFGVFGGERVVRFSFTKLVLFVLIFGRM